VKALILAAGLGTRLMPLTANTPKALVRIHGIPLLEIAIRKLTREGFSDITVNIHHHAGQIIDYLAGHPFPGARINVSDESEMLLDTGGAILHARRFLDGPEPFLVHNVDVISDIDLQALYRANRTGQHLATLAVSHRSSSRYFLFDDKGMMCGWKDTANNKTRWSGEPVDNAKPLAFSGVHVIHPGIFELLTEKGRFSIVDAYLRLARSHPVGSYFHTGNAWLDVGKKKQLPVAARYLSKHPEMIK